MQGNTRSRTIVEPTSPNVSPVTSIENESLWMLLEAKQSRKAQTDIPCLYIYNILYLTIDNMTIYTHGLCLIRAYHRRKHKPKEIL